MRPFTPLLWILLLLTAGCTRTVYVDAEQRHDTAVRDSVQTVRTDRRDTHVADTVLIRTAVRNDTVYMTTEKTHWRTRTLIRRDTVRQVTRDTVQTVRTIVREPPPARWSSGLKSGGFLLLAVLAMAVFVKFFKI